MWNVTETSNDVKVNILTKMKSVCLLIETLEEAHEKTDIIIVQQCNKISSAGS